MKTITEIALERAGNGVFTLEESKQANQARVFSLLRR